MSQSSSSSASPSHASFKVKDHVKWQSPQGETSGHVTQVIRKKTEWHGHTVNASAADPQYEVQSEKSGKFAVHRGDALSHAKS